jgi:hypothetical protein
MEQNGILIDCKEDSINIAAKPGFDFPLDKTISQKSDIVQEKIKGSASLRIPNSKENSSLLALSLIDQAPLGHSSKTIQLNQGPLLHLIQLSAHCCAGRLIIHPLPDLPQGSRSMRNNLHRLTYADIPG